MPTHAPQLLAVGQMTATADVEQNLATCSQLVQKAARRGAALLSLPECFAYIGEKDTDLLEFARPIQSPLIDRYRALAKANGLWLSLGGFQERSEGAPKATNAHLLINAEGELVADYRKIHLFDVDIPSGPKLLESKSTQGGTQLVTAASPVGQLGLSVCYDLRFPELYLSLAQLGAQVLLIPAAFTLTTGKEHWHTLLRARAIETQCYVAAAAQTGKHNARRHSYGHALIVDPWGTVVAECADRTDIAVAEIDLSYLKSVRERMPVWEHRRPDVYGQVGRPA